MYNVCGVVILDLLFSYLLSLSLSLILDLEPPDDSKRKKFIAIGVVSALFLIFLILGILWWKGCFESRTTREQDLMGLDLQTGFFKFWIYILGRMYNVCRVVILDLADEIDLNSYIIV
ncbi:hypothetical protein ACFX13_004410 [Malus domestica]